MRPAKLPAGAGFAAGLLAPQAAQAHIVASRLGDFYTGALHPASDLQDVLLWLAIALLAGTLGAGKAKGLVIVVPLGFLAGVGLAQVYGLSPPRPIVVPALILGLGLAVAADLKAPTGLFLAGVFAIATMRGVANASDTAPETNLVLYAAGLALAGYVAVTLLAAATLVFKGAHRGPEPNWRHIAIRALGSWLAAIGLMTGGLSLAS